MASVGRNEPCPCGSGRRFKLCHGRIDAQPRKVDFVVAGTQKGGTSALDSYLREHAEICMPKVGKEVHYFDNEERFATDRAAGDHSFYERQFAPLPSQRRIGEVTPIYMYWQAAPARIAQYNPDMQFILLLRNPATRAYSQWNMEMKRQIETLSFDDAIRQEDARRNAALPLQPRSSSYVDRGRYATQLKRIWQHVPRSQTLVLKSESFQRDPAPALDAIARFLGVGAFARRTPREVFALPYEQPMSSDAATFLADAYAREIDELEALLGWDLTDWRKAGAT